MDNSLSLTRKIFIILSCIDTNDYSQNEKQRLFEADIKQKIIEKKLKNKPYGRLNN